MASSTFLTMLSESRPCLRQRSKTARDRLRFHRYGEPEPGESFRQVVYGIGMETRNHDNRSFNSAFGKLLRGGCHLLAHRPHGYERNVVAAPRYFDLPQFKAVIQPRHANPVVLSQAVIDRAAEMAGGA